MSPFEPVADSLLAHASFVRRVARSLAGADADDLAQDTWAAALQAGAAEVRSARGWLATIVANLWRNASRAAARRQRREAAAAGRVADSGPSVAAILEREEVRRQVVEAVVALPERLRQVVLLHFYEGLDSFAIGRRLDLPPSTVRSRLQQALAALRARLDAEHGDRRAAWATPLAGWAGAPAPARLGLLLRVVWPLRAVLGAFALGLLAWLTLPLWSGGPGAPPPPAPGPIGFAETKREAAPQTAERPAQRVAAEVPAAAPGQGPEDLWGRVVAAADGAPVAAADVVLQHSDGDDHAGLDPACSRRVAVVGEVRSDAGGWFRFRVARALQHRLVVKAAGFATGHESMCTGGSELVVRLDRPASVAGTVKTTEGAPLGDVLVEALERGGSAARETTRTAADGSFLLTDLASRPTHLAVHPSGLQAPEWRLVEPTPGRSLQVEFTVAAGRSVKGTVHDAETKLPIAGARVATSWAMEDAVVTGADGAFECRGLQERDGLYVQAEGYGDEVLPRLGERSGEPVDVVMRRGFVVTGRVVDPAGLAIEGAYVAAAADVWMPGPVNRTFWRTAAMAPDGRFVLRDLTRTFAPDAFRAPQWQVALRAPGHGTRVLAVPRAAADPGDRDLGELVLQPQGILEGRLVDGEGHPVERATIEVRGVANGLGDLLERGSPVPDAVLIFQRHTTATAPDGRFRLAGLGAGSYQLRAEVPGRTWSVESGPHEVADGVIVVLPDLIADAGLGIEGTVQWNGRPGLPAGTHLTIYAFGAMREQRYAEVAADGRFRIERLEPGKFLLAALDVPNGLALLPQRDVAAGARDVILRLVAAEPIEGRVVGADGAPVRGVQVVFWPAGVVFAHHVTTDGEGHFRLEAAPGVVGKVTAQDPVNMFRQVQQTDVVAGTRDLVLKLPK